MSSFQFWTSLYPVLRPVLMALIKERYDENNSVRRATWQLVPDQITEMNCVQAQKCCMQNPITTTTNLMAVFSWSSILGETEILIFFIWPNVLLIILVSDHFGQIFFHFIIFFLFYVLFHTCNFFPSTSNLITWFLDVLNHCTVWFQLNSLY